MNLLMVLTAIFVLVFIVYSIAILLRTSLGIPIGEHIYTDTSESPGRILISEKLQLRGKPDYLIRQKGAIIPVEVKTGRTPSQPREGHVMQLIAYCALVEEIYKERPKYGIIRYPEAEFRIDYTQTSYTLLTELLTDMRVKSTLDEVHRNHHKAFLCRACGFRDVCTEKLH